MNPQKFVTQIISHEDGSRSAPFTVTMEQLKKAMMTEPVFNDHKSDYILMVGVITDEEQLEVTATPLITIEAMLQTMENQKERANAS